MSGLGVSTPLSLSLPLPLSLSLPLPLPLPLHHPCPPSPLVTTLLDQLLLLSPRTWYGFLQALSKSTFSQFDTTVLSQAILGILLPILVLSLLMLMQYRILGGTGIGIGIGVDNVNVNVESTAAFFDIKNYNNCKLRRLLLPYLVAPWTLHSTWTILEQCKHIRAHLMFYWMGRSKPMASAIRTLEERIQQNRAYRTRRYDVYLPPAAICTTTSNTNSNSSSPNNNNTKAKAKAKGVVLLPGALIPHTAYAEVASRLSDAGLVVVVASMEPLRFAYPHLGADILSMDRIMRKTEEQLRLPNHQSLEWSLMGHSAGAFAAMNLFHTFRQSASTSASTSSSSSSSTTNKTKRRNIHNLVLWGVAGFVSMSTDLSQYENDDKTNVLLVQATLDNVIELTQTSMPALNAHFPADRTTRKWIVGGTHQGFASYGQGEDQNPQVSNPSTISHAKQQQRACDITSRFLLEERS